MREATLFNVRRNLVQYIALFLMIGVLGKVQAQDCEPITVFCQDLHTTFMPEACMVEVWAKDFISKINEPGTDLDDFFISFDRDDLQMSMEFQSTDGSIFPDVEIWIAPFDSNGDVCTDELTRCVVMLDVQDNTGDCPTDICPVDPSPWCGMSIISCTTVQGTDTETTGHVAAILDTRKNSQAPRGDNWSDPVGSGNQLPIGRPEAWRISNLGNIFGISLNPRNGDIFFAASDIYDFDFQQFVTIGPPPPSVVGPAGSAGIYRTNIITPEVVNVLVSTTPNYPSQANFNSTIIGSNLIPNSGNDPNDNARSGNGIGNIDYDLRSDHLFATNLEDGKIYSINATTGIITDVFDPFFPYIHSDGLVEDTERIWGVQVSDCGINSRLFFARNARVPTTTPDVIQPKEVWSVALNSDGTFQGFETIELIVGSGDMSKLTDLSFNSDCSSLLVAERGNAHSAELLKYDRDIFGNWILDRQFFLGLNDLSNTAPTYPGGIVGNSAAGGSAFGPEEENCTLDAACDQLVWGTVNCGDIAADDANPPNAVNCTVYGAQGINTSGNTAATNKNTDIFISIDTAADFLVRLKSNLGDIEFFNCCCPDEPGRNTFGQGLTAIVGGEIYTEDENFISAAKVILSDGLGSSTEITDSKGSYFFEDVTMHGDYNIAPEKEGEFLDGVSTLDLILIQKHILGLESLDSPYKQIAADIDNSGHISTKDLVELRRLILGVSSESDYLSWGFVSPTEEWYNQGTPWPYDNSRTIEDLEANSMHQDFVAVKIGDVNLDNSFISRNRSANRATVQFKSIDNKIYLSLDRTIEASGLQLDLLVQEEARLELLNSPMLALNSSNYNMVKDHILISWNSLDPMTIVKDEVFAILTFENSASGIELSHEKIGSEIYDNKSVRYELSGNWINEYSEVEFIGASPNPFKQDTYIEFELPEAGVVEFEFFSLGGKQIFKTKNEFNKGFNAFKVSRNELGALASGVIVFQMRTDNFTKTDKIVLID